MAKRLRAALGHHLNRQAAVKIWRRSLPLMETGLVGGEQGRDEGLVLFASERTVDVVGAGPARAGLVVARLEPGLIEVDTVTMHDRRDRVEKCELLFAGQPAD